MSLASVRVLPALCLLASTVWAAEPLRFDFSPPFLAEMLQRIEKNRPSLTVPRCAAPPRIDGRLNPLEWTAAARIDGLIFPTGNRAEPLTRVRLMFDDAALYIAAECDAPPGKQAAANAKPEPRDSNSSWSEDCIEIWIKPAPKGDVSYQFVVNTYGTIYDGINTKASGDASYDPDWSNAVSHSEKGWVAEMAIPRAALRLNVWPAQLGFNIGRNGPIVKLCSWTGKYSETEGRLALEGVRELAEASAEHATGTGTGLVIKADRPFARPGDRWIECALRIQPPCALDRARLTAALYRIGDDKPVAEAAAVPARNCGALFADLRSLGLSQARLRVSLHEGAQPLASTETFLSARSPLVSLAAGQRIPVALDLPPGIDQVDAWPVTFGVPFPEGTLWDAAALRLVDRQGREIPCQKEVTGLWATDGAIQWVRLDALISSKDGCEIEAAPGAGIKPVTPLTLTEKEGKIELDTGVARYVLGQGTSPIEAVWLGGTRVASSRGVRGLYVVDQNGQTATASADGETMRVESRGPVAGCVRFEGFYRTTKGEPLARHITRVEAFAGQPFVKVVHTLVLCNDTNKVWFKDIGWEFGVDPGANPSALFGVSRAEWQKSISQPLDAGTPGAYMLQDQHYLLGHGANHFAAVRTDAAGKAATLVEGEECGDWTMLTGAKAGFAVACKESARQHPKEFEVQRDRIILRFFSNRSGEELDFRPATLVKKWDLLNWYKNTLSHAYVADAPKIVEKVGAFASNAIGWAKTHELLLAPMGPANSAGPAARLAYLNRHPFFALVSPEWTYKSEVMGPLHPKDPKQFPEAEKYIDDTFRLWEKRTADWGDYGFVDYFSGPHLEYGGKWVRPNRYNIYTYTLRADLWRVYARSGERRVREFAEGTNRGYADDIIAHWDGNGKVKGLFIAGGGDSPSGDTTGCLPFFWEGGPTMEISSSTNMDNFLYDYQLTGHRRAKDVVLEYAEGIKRFWTPDRAKRDWRAIMITRMLAQAYGLTWDPALRELAEATTDTYVDPEGALGLSKERPYRWSTYKTRTDLAGLLDAWRIIGNPRYYDLSLRVARYWWQTLLGVMPIFYTNPQGTMGSLLYRESGDPTYPEMLALQVRQAAGDYRHGTQELASAITAGAEAVTFAFQGIPYSQDAMIRSGADKACVASWVAYEDFGYPTSIAAWKADQGTLDVDLGWAAQSTAGEGSAGGVRVRAIRPGGAGLGLNVVTEQSGEWDAFARVVIPKDAPECAYEILPTGEGFHIAAAHSKVPLVLHAPAYWRPLKQVPAVKWYFSLPKDSQDAQVFFEGSARLYDPQGNPWQDGKPLKGWVDLPADKPGLWAMEPVEHMLVSVKNLPPFFAARDPKNYFAPEIAWARQKPYRPPEKIPPGTEYVPGAIDTPGNKALHFERTKRVFLLDGGAPHPSGDGLQFIPFKQGTIEFFFKPDWSTFDLPEKAWRTLVGMNPVAGESWSLGYNKDPAALNWMGTHVLNAYFMTDGPGRRISMRSWRQTILSNEDWVHIAWVWGMRDVGTHTSSKREQRITTRFFVNGKAGFHYTYGDDQWRGNQAADMPKVFHLGQYNEAAYDELRISDVQRYWEDFVPPPRDREFQLDKNTRALFHFNGNVDGESYGYTGLLPAAVKP